MIRVALRSLRFHAGSLAASFVALFLGATIVIGSAGVLETGLHNTAPPRRLTAAPLVVTGEQRWPGTTEELTFPERRRLDAGLAGVLEAVPGVAEAVPDVSFPAAVGVADAGEGGATAATGHGWSSARLTPFRLTEGTGPSADDEVVLGAALAAAHGVGPGDRVAVPAGGRDRRYTVSGLAEGAGADRTLFLTDAEAARVAGHPGTVESFGVFLAPGAEPGRVAGALREAVASDAVTVLAGDGRGRAEDPDVLAQGPDLVPLAAAFGSLSAMVTVFGVAGTVGLSLRRRRQEAALLRAVGATPRQVRRLVVAETLAVAVLATAPACLLGPRLGRWLFTAFTASGVVPDTIAYRAGWIPVAAGAAGTLLAALGAALVAARAAGRTQPVEALAEAAADRRWFSGVRLTAGLLCLGGGVALSVVTAGMPGPDAGSVATPAALLWTAGFALLGPVLTRAVVAALRWPLSALGGTAGRLAALNARAATARVAAAVMPVMLATGLAVSLVYLQTTQAEGARQAFDESLVADLVITSDAGGLPAGAVGAVARTPGVAAASAQVTSTGFLEPDEPMVASGGGEEDAGPQPTEVALQGLTASGAGGTTAFRAVTGSLDDLTGTTVALPAAYAEGRRIGEAVPMRLGDGTRITPTLVATLDARRGYETALLPAELLTAHTDAGLIPRVLVRAAAGTDPGELAAALATATGEVPGVRVTGREALAEARAEQDRTQATMAYLVIVVVVGYAALSLVNAQVLATGERRREYALQRVVGATRRQVRRMMLAEAGLIVTAGVLLGTLAAAGTLVPASISVLETPLPSGSPWLFAAVAAGALGLTMATTLLATHTALRGRPVLVTGAGPRG